MRHNAKTLVMLTTLAVVLSGAPIAVADATVASGHAQSGTRSLLPLPDTSAAPDGYGAINIAAEQIGEANRLHALLEEIPRN
jgi:hypothetical protein